MDSILRTDGSISLDHAVIPPVKLSKRPLKPARLSVSIAFALCPHHAKDDCHARRVDLIHTARDLAEWNERRVRDARDLVGNVF